MYDFVQGSRLKPPCSSTWLAHADHWTIEQRSDAEQRASYLITGITAGAKHDN
ncbi:MAG: hypothetical protein HC924_15305 [Synechococcaceae cyanobacterium SM2_3_2]|nr:hypothetical protein [Synechococcaceae cyanobacterium SM2_3_2]